MDMIGEICAEVKNYFTLESDMHIDNWTISNGEISPSIDLPTEYFRIVGSRLNDGVHKVSDLARTPLNDETFHGAIWVMSPPPEFLALVKDIETWQEEYGKATGTALSPFASESFGGYSYSKNSANSSRSGASASPVSWQQTYAYRLVRFRRIREL